MNLENFEQQFLLKTAYCLNCSTEIKYEVRLVSNLKEQIFQSVYNNHILDCGEPALQIEIGRVYTQKNQGK